MSIRKGHAVLAAAVLLSACAPGYYILKAPMQEPSLSSPGEGTFIVAGCVPQDRPPTGVFGSNFTLCNDLSMAKSKVVESSRVSCMDMFQVGVLDGVTLVEVKSRKWDFFGFSCRPLEPDGTLGGPAQSSPPLFDFSGTGGTFTTSVPAGRLPVGVFEVNNALSVRQSLLQIGLMHESAEAILSSGAANVPLSNPGVSPRIPDASPVFLGTDSWSCPAGMVITGAAIGHIPDDDGEGARPVYILAECRKLRKK